MIRARKPFTAALTGAAVFTSAAWADPPALLFPLDCTLGETCFLQQFMDRDPGPGWRDFTCGPASYDGHTGTDIRVADFEAMAAGWPVRAAAPGIVRATRDGVPDGGTAAAPEGQGCGNGVVIDHQDGWQTQYCHLAEGSIAVASGDAVEAGTPLGEIGYSGNTEFPHVEFLLRQNGTPVDPFDPGDLSTCGSGAAPLWSEPIPVRGGGLLSIGFSPGVPEYDAIQAGTADAETLAADAPIVLWGFVHGGREGDALLFRIFGPDGTAIHENRVELDRTQAQLFRASGRRPPAEGWPAGAYAGEVTLVRGTEILHHRRVTIPVRP
ncbi:M23 family metallopeptidase [Maritalea mobilis]|uniref:M23 family metallopeptidase n=1 Tax=Maritalea mobilis TaxID=483324 RepID=UPI001C986154|nr:M23 family metallopeptidase [Maritalea mobilis]MBY6201213.1 M23 family metallopeptidase [Maritalea mobilis]